MRAIRSELGEVDERTEEIKDSFGKRSRQAKMPKEVQKEAYQELERLEQMHPDAADASIIRTYLDWLVEMPWAKSTIDSLDLQEGQESPRRGPLQSGKGERADPGIPERSQTEEEDEGPHPLLHRTSRVSGRPLSENRSPGLLGGKFVRISLGGIHDEAEIRGHRRTYVGALPGRIIQSIKQAGSNNPVFMMDEVDKIGVDFRGDPASALLEVLDPEQNNAFSDHYLNVPFDLSKVMFITTGNLTDPIPSALKDRMEIIDLPGYTEMEKLKIARTFLLPRQMEENGINPKVLQISDQGHPPDHLSVHPGGRPSKS